MALYLEICYARLGERDVDALGLVVGIQVACNAIVASSICTVRGDVDLDEGVVFHTKILLGRHTHRCVGWKHHDAIVVATYANLVFGTDHAQRLLATDLAFLDSELLVAIIEHCAYGRHDYLLTSGHVGSAAHDLQRFCIWSYSCGCDMQVVRVWVIHASDDFTYYQSFQTTFDGLYLLYFAYFQTNGSQDVCYLLCAVIERDVTFEPIIRYIHNVFILF